MTAMNTIARVGRAYWRINLRAWNALKAGVRQVPFLRRPLEAVGWSVGLYPFTVLGVIALLFLAGLHVHAGDMDAAMLSIAFIPWTLAISLATTRR